MISTRANELFAQLPGIRDGQAESVHQGRVACRRLRELLPLIGDDSRAGQAQKVLTEVGRQLGRVRDLDVMTALLMDKEQTVPAAALAVASARRTLGARLRDERRRLVKTLERAELARVAAFRHVPTAGWSLRRPVIDLAEPPWGAMMRDRVGLRAHGLRSDVEHATGIYFPNRLHRARTAVKKLRYVVEAAADIGAWNPPHLLDDLKKVQALLGKLHDAQVVLDELETLTEEVVPNKEISALRSAFDSDIARFHHRYLGRRARLMAIADACDRFAVGRRERRFHLMGKPAVAASAFTVVAIPTTMMLLHRRAG